MLNESRADPANDCRLFSRLDCGAALPKEARQLQDKSEKSQFEISKLNNRPRPLFKCHDTDAEASRC